MSDAVKGRMERIINRLKLTPLARFRTLIGQRASGHAMIDFLTEIDPDLKDLYTYSVEDGLTVEEHTQRVYSLYEQQSRYYLPQIRLPDLNIDRLLRAVILLHDIGKAQSLEQTGSKDSQHAFTVPLLQQTLTRLGFSEREITIATELVNNDILGEMVTGKISASDAYDKLVLFAKNSGMSDIDYYHIQLLLYISDAASYDRIRSASFVSENGKLSPKGLQPLEALLETSLEPSVELIQEEENRLDEEAKALLSDAPRISAQIKSGFSLRSTLETTLGDMKSLEDLALLTLGSSDPNYERIRLKRIALESKYRDPVVNPYKQVTSDDKAVAASFLPTHKVGNLETLISILETGSLSSGVIREIEVPEERFLRSQEDSIFLSAGIPYSHLHIKKAGAARHDEPLIVFDRDSTYASPGFRSTPRDSFGYDDERELQDYVMDPQELSTYMGWMLTNGLVRPEVSDFQIRPDRSAYFGTFFPEIFIDGTIPLNAISSIILTPDDKNTLLERLVDNTNFERIVGEQASTPAKVEELLNTRFGISFVEPEEGRSVDQTYWSLIGQNVPGSDG